MSIIVFIDGLSLFDFVNKYDSYDLHRNPPRFPTWKELLNTILPADFSEIDHTADTIGDAWISLDAQVRRVIASSSPCLQSLLSFRVYELERVTDGLGGNVINNPFMLLRDGNQSSDATQDKIDLYFFFRKVSESGGVTPFTLHSNSSITTKGPRILLRSSFNPCLVSTDVELMSNNLWMSAINAAQKLFTLPSSICAFRFTNIEGVSILTADNSDPLRTLLFRNSSVACMVFVSLDPAEYLELVLVQSSSAGAENSDNENGNLLKQSKDITIVLPRSELTMDSLLNAVQVVMFGSAKDSFSDSQSFPVLEVRLLPALGSVSSVITSPADVAKLKSGSRLVALKQRSVASSSSSVSSAPVTFCFTLGKMKVNFSIDFDRFPLSVSVLYAEARKLLMISDVFSFKLFFKSINRTLEAGLRINYPKKNGMADITVQPSDFLVLSASIVKNHNQSEEDYSKCKELLETNGVPLLREQLYIGSSDAAGNEKNCFESLIAAYGVPSSLSVVDIQLADGSPVHSITTLSELHLLVEINKAQTSGKVEKKDEANMKASACVPIPSVLSPFEHALFEMVFHRVSLELSVDELRAITAIESSNIETAFSLFVGQHGRKPRSLTEELDQNYQAAIVSMKDYDTLSVLEKQIHLKIFQVYDGRNLSVAQVQDLARDESLETAMDRFSEYESHFGKVSNGNELSIRSPESPLPPSEASSIVEGKVTPTGNNRALTPRLETLCLNYPEKRQMIADLWQMQILLEDEICKTVERTSSSSTFSNNNNNSSKNNSNIGSPKGNIGGSTPQSSSFDRLVCVVPQGNSFRPLVTPRAVVKYIHDKLGILVTPCSSPISSKTRWFFECPDVESAGKVRNLAPALINKETEVVMFLAPGDSEGENAGV